MGMMAACGVPVSHGDGPAGGTASGPAPATGVRRRPRWCRPADRVRPRRGGNITAAASNTGSLQPAP